MSNFSGMKWRRSDFNGADESFCGGGDLTHAVVDHQANPTAYIVEVIWGDSGEWGAAAYRSSHIPSAVAWNFATAHPCDATQKRLMRRG